MENSIQPILNKALKVQAIVKQFANMAGGKTLRFIDGNFAAQGWQGKGFQPWKKRKRINKKNAGKNILSNIGTLRRGFNYGEVAPGEVKVYNNVPYAKIHNEGGVIHQSARSETFQRNRYKRGNKTGAFKKGVQPMKQGFTFKERTITIPKRQFAPINFDDSPVLIKSIEREIIKQIIAHK
jgi:phage gpG-like protein